MKIYLLIAFILIGLNSNELSQQEEVKTPSKRVLRKPDSTTIIKIQFCQSWSSAGYFNYVKEQLELFFSDIKVTAERYPLKNPRKTIYNTAIGIQVFLIILTAFSGLIQSKLEFIIGSDNFKAINENKLAKIAMVFLMGQYIGQIISNAGAFEVFCDDKLIWSTIEHNGIKPNLSTIIRLVKQLE